MSSMDPVKHAYLGTWRCKEKALRDGGQEEGMQARSPGRGQHQDSHARLHWLLQAFRISLGRRKAPMRARQGTSHPGHWGLRARMQFLVEADPKKNREEDRGGPPNFTSRERGSTRVRCGACRQAAAAQPSFLGGSCSPM